MSSIRVFPLHLPHALVQGHGFTPEPNGRERQRDQGEMRIRPRWRSVPDLCAVTWLFTTQAQFDSFDAFYEDELLSGSLEFDVRVQGRGTAFGRRWYTAQVVGDYRCDVLPTMLYRVTATLRLIEDLGTLRIPPGIEATIGLNFGLTAGTVPPTLASVIGLDFGLSAALPVGPPAAIIGLDFGLVWATPSEPEESAARETDASDARETEAGDTRITD